ncbi:hypothetical protein [Luteibacter sp. 329MFSha]|uniref:hypothetical protein n=1 Tax=Luteibacter sp. 329MFSha TaxID=1798239 RepID=UPI0008B96AC0|nr:hypothetical protein [Luteibacter sp. 329MFSha]SEV96615.1 hypothetical protein SAMN04515660_1365 [Luteibacter sp. 329MFSha]
MPITPIQLALGGAVVFLFLVAMVWRAHIALPNRPSFKGKTVEAWLDNDAQCLRVMPRGEARTYAIPFGRLAFDFKPQTYVEARRVHHDGAPARTFGSIGPGGAFNGRTYEGSGGWSQTVTETHHTGLTNATLSVIDVPEALHRQWCGEDTKAQTRQVFLASLKGGEAEAFERWLRRHAKVLRPDVDRLRGQWRQQCDVWLSTCRRQRTGQGKPVVECFRFCHDGIRYLAVEDSGAILAARGDAPLLTDVGTSRALEGERLTVLRNCSQEMTFDLTPDDIKALQKLVRKGRLSF